MDVEVYRFFLRQLLRARRTGAPLVLVYDAGGGTCTAARSRCASVVRRLCPRLHVNELPPYARR